MNLLTLGALVFLLIIFFGFGMICFIGAPYVPSFDKEIRKALSELYPLSKKDVLVDLGSGDGKVLSIACEMGAKAAIGVELNLMLVLYSRLRLAKYAQAKVCWENICKFQLPKDTTIIYLFCEGRDIKKYFKYLRAESKRIGHPLTILSHGFEMPGLKPLKSKRAYFLYKIDGNTKF